MKKALAIVGLVGIGIAGVVLFRHFRNQAKLLMDYCYRISSYQIIELNTKRIAFTADLAIKNKSKIDLTITKYVIDIYLNKKWVAQVHTPDKYKPAVLLAENFGALSFTVDLSPKNTLKNAASWDTISGLLLDQRNVKLAFIGNITASAGGLSIKNFPINIETTIGELMGDPSAQSVPCI